MHCLNRTGSSRNDEFIGHSSCLPSSMPEGRHQTHWYALLPLIAPPQLGDTSSAPPGVTPYTRACLISVEGGYRDHSKISNTEGAASVELSTLSLAAYKQKPGKS